MTLKGNLGIGHTRYSTMGGADNVQLVQPFLVHTSYGTIAVAHNGELVNSNRLRERILSNGVGLSTGNCFPVKPKYFLIPHFSCVTGSDSELITQALSMEPPEQFKQDYMNKKFKLKSNKSNMSNGSINHNEQDLEDSFNHSSPYATHLSQKEANFVARILHVSNLVLLNISHFNMRSVSVDVSYSSFILIGDSL